MYIKDLIKLINRKDIRSAKVWCMKNDVVIYQDSSGRYVIQSEFFHAYNKPVIDRYKSEYGESWHLFYNRLEKGNLHLSLAVEKEIIDKSRYQPKSIWSNEILSSIRNNT